jgi:expansin (peptidoglycan-binding protein)
MSATEEATAASECKWLESLAKEPALTFCASRLSSITNTANGRRVEARVRDSCPPCGEDDLDLSPAAFKALGHLDEGVLSIKWNFRKRD